MKKAIIILSALFCILTFAYIANAGEVTLAWDAPTNSAWGTRLYIGTASGQYDFSEDAGAGTVQFTIGNLAPGRTYFFAAKHYFEGHESGYSNEVAHTVPSEITELPTVPPLDDSVKRYEITIRKLD